MTFQDFTFPEVCDTFGLTLHQAVLYPRVPPLDRGQDFLERMVGDGELATAINTEKARSEFMIAPVLSEVRRYHKTRFALFSGVEFSVDPARGLNGFCDFLFTRSPLQLRITSPVIAIAEAKNVDLRAGFGQCIASMVAAREFNADATVIHGVVTTGSEWQFVTLAGNDLTFDTRVYLSTELPAIMGVLAHILETA